jgi:hypothetical protein
MRFLCLATIVAACGGKPVDRVEHPLPTTMVGTGHPYWKQLAHEARASLELPRELEPKTPPEGCFQLAADGKIGGTKLVHGGKVADVDAAVKKALDAVMRARNDHPIPVPAELKSALDGWVCLALEPLVPVEASR